MGYFRFLHRKLISNSVLLKRHKYYVLLPEIPEDTPETNPLLKTSSLPPFSQLTRHKYISAVGKLLIEHETGINKLNTELSDPNVPKTVQNVILPLDRLSNPLDFAWATFKAIHTVTSDAPLADFYVRLQPRVMVAKRQQYLSPAIYQAFKDLHSSENQLVQSAQRVVEKHLLESRLSGMDLEGDDYQQLKDCLYRLLQFKKQYRERLTQGTTKFYQPLEFKDVKDFPQDFIHQIADDHLNPLNGPWKVTLAPNIYPRFLEYCDDRVLRWNVWYAKHTRASSLSGHKASNSIPIEEIRTNRKQQANLLGYSSFAEMSMETKMAGSIENVMALITTMHIKSQATTLKDIQNLQDFASENDCPYRLELWDLPYWQRKHREHLYRLDAKAISQYFPLPTVLRGLFGFFHKLFGVTIVESNEDVDTWHDDVTYYKILDQNGVQLASFFLDPYARPDEKLLGNYMEVGRNRSDVVGSEPLSYLFFNFPAPASGKPSLLSFNDLAILLQKCGNLLQHSLTNVPYNDVSGLTNLEWDVVNVCPLFMTFWLTHYKTVASFSAHVDSNEKIPQSLHQKIIRDLDYMCSLRLTEELYLSALDLELHTKNDYWLEITKRLWAKYIPFPFEKYQAHPCSFPQIFCDEYPAAYFSNLWAEMIATDAFGAFQEVGLDNDDAIKEMGRRFQETFLSIGGGAHPSEVFRTFRGRDPSADALARRYHLDKQIL